MKIPIAIILSALILAASHIYANRYQKIGDVGALNIYKDLVTGELHTMGLEEDEHDIKQLKIKFIPIE